MEELRHNYGVERELSTKPTNSIITYQGLYQSLRGRHPEASHADLHAAIVNYVIRLYSCTLDAPWYYLFIFWGTTRNKVPNAETTVDEFVGTLSKLKEQYEGNRYFQYIYTQRSRRVRDTLATNAYYVNEQRYLDLCHIYTYHVNNQVHRLPPKLDNQRKQLQVQDDVEGVLYELGPL